MHKGREKKETRDITEEERDRKITLCKTGRKCLSPIKKQNYDDEPLY